MSDYIFPSHWLEKLSEKNIKEPSAVQKQIIPLLSENKNIIYQSETGTGKTLAYLIPLLEKIDPNIKEVQLLIVSPTHELASQIKTEVSSVCDYKSALLIGGAPLKRQQELLKETPLIVVGGPARLLELIHLKKLKVHQVKAFVLDEVDRLFCPELRDETTALISFMPETSQFAACSATIKPKIEEILKDSLPGREMETVCLPPEDILRRKITHWAIFAEQRDKIDTLRRFITAESPEKLLVFTARPDQASIIAAKLQYKKIDCEVLHARADKQARKAAVDRFRSGKVKILITSDLSSRGLDFPNVTHVIQMDVPSDNDFFVHRAGRTARAGAEGLNVIIGDAHEMRILSKIEKKLGITIYPKQLYGGKIVAPESEEN